MSGDTPEAEAVDQALPFSERIDSSKPHPARVYDVFLGGRDNYPADRAAARAALAANPRGFLNVWHNRDFVRRAVSHLTLDAGIRQFLDVGTGLPSVENVHEIAQRIAPQARIVYVDNDPVVLAHAHALLTGSAQGTTDYVDADLRDPEAILREARRTLDFDEPVALVLAAILHFVEDETAYDVVARLAAALSPGSYLILSHLTADLNPGSGLKTHKAYKDSGLNFVLRSKQEIQRFFTENGFDVLEPGIVPAHHWRPDHRPWPRTARTPVESEIILRLDDLDKLRYQDINDVTDADVNVYGALAYKP